MFDELSAKLTAALQKLTGRGVLTEEAVKEGLREIRRVLLEADVSFDLTREFLERVEQKAIGAELLKAVRPGDQLVKIVYDELVALLGEKAAPIAFASVPPTVILLVGLQGSGKTTTTAKIAHRLKSRDKKRVLMASLDTRRPAAQEQLRVLGEQTAVDTLPIIAGQTPVQIAKRALEAARLSGYDVVLLDTAGRTSIDEELMAEVADIKAATNPHEILLVVDSLTGQDAVNTAKAFDSRLAITGTVLTRADGDGRGGAALSMRAVTGLPIKFLGVSEKIDGLDVFDAARVAGRILGQGDVVALVEKAAQDLDTAKAEAMARKLAKGQFDLDMMADQFAQMKRMGGMEGLMGFLPGVQKVKKQMAEANINDKMLDRQAAIISSMTKAERKKPDILQASRKRRIAAGAGVDVADVNRLLKQHRQMADAFKMMSKDGGKGFARMAGMMGGGGMDRLKSLGGGKLPQPDPAQLEELGKMAAGGKLPGLGSPGAPKLPGLGGLPPGFNPFKKS
mgnify:CR=1 FL=1